MTTSNLVCVWYPSGGFGHFINAVLTIYGQGFTKPFNTDYVFTKDGTSHNIELVLPKYFKNNKSYKLDIQRPGTHVLLIDNGIDDESTDWFNQFPDAQVIKLGYSDYSWPIVAHTMIKKALRQSIEETILGGDWATAESWSQRERLYLFLRDHNFRHAWRNDTRFNFIDASSLLDYTTLIKTLQQSGIAVDNFYQFWRDWFEINQPYLQTHIRAQQVLTAVKQQEPMDLTDITDLWDQAVINYYIWLTFKFEVPANDYANWFNNVAEINQMLRLHGVINDTN